MALWIARQFNNGIRPPDNDSSHSYTPRTSRWTTPIRLAIVGAEEFDEPGIDAAAMLRAHLAYLRDIHNPRITLVDARTGEPNFLIGVRKLPPVTTNFDDWKKELRPLDDHVRPMLVVGSPDGERRDRSWLRSHRGGREPYPGLSYASNLLDDGNAVVGALRLCGITNSEFLLGNPLDLTKDERSHLYLYNIIAQVDDMVITGIGPAFTSLGVLVQERAWTSVPADIRKAIYRAHAMPGFIGSDGFFDAGGGDHPSSPRSAGLQMDLEMIDIYYASNVPNGIAAEDAMPYLLATLRRRSSISGEGK
jgi:hypothetical protein